MELAGEKTGLQQIADAALRAVANKALFSSAELHAFLRLPLRCFPPLCPPAPQALQHEIANFGKERDKRIKAAKDKVGGPG